MAETETEVRAASGFTVKGLSKTVGRQSSSAPSRLQELVVELRELEAKLRLGGGADKIEKQHQQGKLTVRERIELLLDRNSFQQEIGLLVGYDQYRRGEKGKGERGKEGESQVPSPKSQEIGQAPAAGVVTTIGYVGGREVV